MNNIKPTKQQMIHLQERVHTDKNIAATLQISIARVCQLRKEFGIPIFSSKRHNYIRNRFIYEALVDNKISKKELARVYNMSEKTITRIVASFKQQGYDNDNQQH